jgi:hypothetical protein
LFNERAAHATSNDAWLSNLHSASTRHRRTYACPRFPCMGLFLSKSFGTAAHLFSFVGFFVSI